MVSILQAERRKRVKGRMHVPIGLIPFFFFLSRKQWFSWKPHTGNIYISLVGSGLWPLSLPGKLERCVLLNGHTAALHTTGALFVRNNRRLEVRRPARSVCHNTAQTTRSTGFQGSDSIVEAWVEVIYFKLEFWADRFRLCLHRAKSCGWKVKNSIKYMVVLST